jgi:hypothetical protein
MNKKNVISIAISAAVFVAVAALLYRYFAPPTAGTGIKVLVPAPVNPNFNQEQLKVLKEDTVDYNQNISPTSNLNANGANKASSILENSLNRGN